MLRLLSYRLVHTGSTVYLKQMVMHLNLNACTAHNIRTDVNHILERFKTRPPSEHVRAFW
ncbi:hypothetical protein L9F63_013547, partial [Diploptera punctata]